MTKFFSPDGKFYGFMSRLTDILKLNFLWLICSLPVVTAGAATIAAFSITLRMVEDTEGHIARNFFKAFKSNLKQGIPMSFITLLGAWAVYLNFEIFKNADSPLFLATGIVSGYLFIFSLLYTYPLLARYENTIINTLKNSFRISMKYFMRSFFILLIVALEIVIIMWNTTTLFVGALIGPACIIFTISGPAMAIFRLIDKESANTGDSEDSENSGG